MTVSGQEGQVGHSSHPSLQAQPGGVGGGGGGNLPEATPLLSANPGQYSTIGSRGTIW